MRDCMCPCHSISVTHHSKIPCLFGTITHFPSLNIFHTICGPHTCHSLQASFLFSFFFQYPNSPNLVKKKKEKKKREKKPRTNQKKKKKKKQRRNPEQTEVKERRRRRRKKKGTEQPTRKRKEKKKKSTMVKSCD